MTSHNFSKGKCVALAALVQGHARSRMYTPYSAVMCAQTACTIEMQVCGDVNRNMGESVGEGKGKQEKEYGKEGGEEGREEKRRGRSILTMKNRGSTAVSWEY